jgi:ABC-type transport system substrate-binding protein
MTGRLQKMDRRALFASGAAAALLAATGVSAAAGPQPGGRLRIAVSGASRTDSFDSLSPMGFYMQIATQGAVFDTLTEIAADGTLRGELATSWRGDATARRWVFDLRRDVTFHDGAGFTAEDVVVSLSRHLDHRLSAVNRIEAVDRHRVMVELTQSDPQFPLLLSRPEFIIYPSENMDAALTQGIGTGLYRVTKFQAGRQFIGTRVARHWKDGMAGWFDQVELVSLPSESIRAEALRDRLVDVADLSSADHLDKRADIILLPQASDMTHAVWGDIGLPVRLGTAHPLDNLRAAERWWKA